MGWDGRGPLEAGKTIPKNLVKPGEEMLESKGKKVGEIMSKFQ